MELQVSTVRGASDTAPACPGGAPLPPFRGLSIPVPGRYTEAPEDGQNLVLFLRPMPAHFCVEAFWGKGLQPHSWGGARGGMLRYKGGLPMLLRFLA